MHAELARALLALPLLLPVLLPALAQDPGSTERTGAGGMTTGQREAMWPAPSVEDWAKPVLITFQRTWEDAVAVSKETGRPILVCTNMDGEIASEHYAGIRYRQPDIAKLYEPYVCVIASVYRHTPRDHDEEGRRVLCPRFGSVTCSEHISIEPFLFETFFDGQRVAPRHVMVELDGSEVFDVFYAFDTQSVFDRIQKGIADRPAPEPRTVRGDRSIIERVESRDIADRLAVEAAFDGGDAELRRALLEKARSLGADAPLELLRRGLYSFDADQQAIAREALTAAQSEDAVHLITEVLRAPLAQGEREQLVSALERLGANSLRARTVASVQRGLAQAEYSMDVEAWQAKLSGQKVVERDRGEVAVRLSGLTRADSAADATARLEAAEAALDLSEDPQTTGAYAALLLEDAHRAAVEARQLGASGWALHAVTARLEHLRGNTGAAFEQAELAMASLPEVAADRTSMVVLALFAHGREQAIREALAAKREWPKEWLADVHAAYDLLVRHPLGLADHAVNHHDFLRRLGALGEADRVLAAGLERFPDSLELHTRHIQRVLAEGGLDTLEGTYASMAEQRPGWTRGEWFRGYASLLAAEEHRRRRGQDAARQAYERSVVHFDRAIEREPEVAFSADHFAALAIAGQARLALERRDLAGSVALLVQSFERCPTAAASPDGNNMSPMDVARMLRPRLRGEEHAELRAQLEAALQKLAAINPRLLDLPDYERPTGR